MKTKLKLYTLAALFAGVVPSTAATMIINNVTDGPGDTLYATSGNVPMNGGIVVMGYFSAGITQSQIDTIPELFSNLGNFTIVTSLAPGSPSTSLGGAFAGYAQQDNQTLLGTITGTNPLIGRTVYSIITSASSLASSTLASEFALLNLGAFIDDVPFEKNFSSDPKGQIPVIGSVGNIVGDFAGDASDGTSSFGTLKMSVIPEPSAALLGALGALGLLRRRRN